MDPITLTILGIAVLVAIAAVIELTILTIEWLAESFNSLKTGDKDEIGFTVQTALANGKYEIVGGVFNKRTNEIVGEGAVKIKADKLDTTVGNAHDKEKVVIYPQEA